MSNERVLFDVSGLVREGKDIVLDKVGVPNPNERLCQILDALQYLSERQLEGLKERDDEIATLRGKLAQEAVDADTESATDDEEPFVLELNANVLKGAFLGGLTALLADRFEKKRKRNVQCEAVFSGERCVLIQGHSGIHSTNPLRKGEPLA